MFGNKRNVKFNNNTPSRKMGYREYVASLSSGRTSTTQKRKTSRKPCNCGKSLLKR